MARPTKYCLEIVQELCKWIVAGNSKEDAAILSGIGSTTLFKWQKQYVEFREDLKEAELQCKARNIARIQKAAEKSWTAAAWWLERKHKDEFARKEFYEEKKTKKSLEELKQEEEQLRREIESAEHDILLDAEHDILPDDARRDGIATAAESEPSGAETDAENIADSKNARTQKTGGIDIQYGASAVVSRGEPDWEDHLELSRDIAFPP